MNQKATDINSMNRETTLKKFPQFKDGMSVKSQDGENLGKISSIDEDSFGVTKGLFFPKDFTARYEDIVTVSDDIIYLNQNVKDLSEWKSETNHGWKKVNELNDGMSPPVSSLDADSFSEVITVPVMEEELDAKKVMRETGTVRIKKVVHTEYKHFTVPVTKEEVIVERVAVGAQNSASDRGFNDEAFKESTITIPVREEEVEIHKRTVVKEEVRVSKERHQETQEVSGEIQKEEVSVEREAGLTRNKNLNREEKSSAELRVAKKAI
jgi:uncharacterized protein (TIGR02271 family)